MRLDVRKSLTLGNAKQMTPTVNLMNPQWRQSFQTALQKLGGEFRPVQVRIPEAAQGAVEAQNRLDRAKSGYPASTAPVGRTIQTQPQANAYQAQLLAASKRLPRAPREDAPVLPVNNDLDAGVAWGSAGAHGGNALAVALSKSPHSLLRLAGTVANFGAPAAGYAIAPQLAPRVADRDLRADATKYRAAGLLADAEAQRLRGGDGRSAALGQFYAKNPDIFAAYREQSPELSPAGVNAWINPEMGASMALARASRSAPVVGGVMGLGLGHLAASKARNEAIAANARIEAGNAERERRGLDPLPAVPIPPDLGAADYAMLGSMPAAGYAGAKAPVWASRGLAAPLAARAGLTTVAESALPTIAGRGTLAGLGTAALPATLAINALSGGVQLAKARSDPRIVDAARADALRGHGVATGLGRTLMGDPIGAATVFDSLDPNSEVSQAARNDVRATQVGAVPSSFDEKGVGVGPFLPYDKLKQHVQVREAIEAAPSVPNSIVAQLVTDTQMDPTALQYQAKRPFTRLSAKDSEEYARQIAERVKGAWVSPQTPDGVPMTEQAVHEIAGLVQTLGPEAAYTALVPTPDHDDRLDELRLQAILNPKWVPKNVHDARVAIYNHYYAPTKPSKP